MLGLIKLSKCNFCSCYYFYRTAYNRSSKHIQEENRVNSMMHTIAKLKLMELGEEQQFKRFQEHISPNEISTDEE